jgi:hypothetical protein
MATETDQTDHPSLEIRQAMTPEPLVLYGPWNLGGFVHSLRDIQVKHNVLANTTHDIYINQYGIRRQCCNLWI